MYNRFLKITIALAVTAFSLVGGHINSTNAQSNCTGNQIFIAKACAGDATSPVENELFEIVNRYRKANGRRELRSSAPLSIIANRRILDLTQNMKTLTHSWSNCPYDIKDEKTYSCVTDAPKRLNVGYLGEGYETLFRTTSGKANPVPALQAWQKSTLHNSIILNAGIFSDLEWDEVGVAVEGPYAVLWFGNPKKTTKNLISNEPGIGVGYDAAVAGLSKILSINEKSASVEANSWQGFSADKKIRLEIFGNRKDISEANIAVSMKLEAGKLTPDAQTAISTLLKNLFPEWPEGESWVVSMVNAISLDKNVSRTKLVRKIAIELKAAGPDSIRLLIKPYAKPGYVEIF